MISTGGPCSGPRIGIDLGGTKIAAVILDAAGHERARTRVPTPRDYPSTLAALAGVVRALEQDAGPGPVEGVGIALPGRVAEGRVTAVNLPWLAGHSLADDLRRHLARESGARESGARESGERPRVALANDADCFALSEARDGAAAGAGLVFGAILGTGAGGGLVAGGRVLPGARGLAGEWGHLPLPWREEADPPPRRCGCGRWDCLETLVSGNGLGHLYQVFGGTADADAEAVASRAAAGDQAAGQALGLHARALARGLALVITLLDPDVIVLGGGLSALGHLYEAVPRLWGQWTLPPAPGTRLLPPRHGGDSGLRGAAWLV